ncbi:calcium-activated chloride channel-domain-containing protein [Auriculariales sp. MPI-PUGE-AT-0066]|nr:calcium-activated chloride channel-domain-containing protein [Auriculariales sp. MPI-PUGE-AT-0066]
MASVDLVLVFRARKTLSKQEAIEEAKVADVEYTQLLNLLCSDGYRAVGRQGDGDDLLVFISAPWHKLMELIRKDQHADFLHGLPASSLPIIVDELHPSKLSQANRLRLIHAHLTATLFEGGLGLTPQSKDWPRLDSILALHDSKFNDSWMHSWTREQKGFGLSFSALDKMKDQFGEEVALYFSFLSFYTKSLWFPAGLGLLFFLIRKPYNTVYSGLLCLWAVTFVEWWRIRERVIAIRWGTQGSRTVEKRRPDFIATIKHDDPDEEDFPWYIREGRTAAGIPVILLFVGILAALNTAIFAFEAFISILYTGPLHQYISFLPTILFVGLIPQVVQRQQKVARRLTDWENHKHRSTHESSLTIKVFALSAVVAYLGLALSSFVYIPFGARIMPVVHAFLTGSSSTNDAAGPAETTFTTAGFKRGLTDATERLDASRLQKQMFAYMVTNQIVGVLLEIGLPMILRIVQNARSAGSLRKGLHHNHARAEDNTAEKDLLQEVRRQVALPDYTVFSDYAEMVTQFGYVVLWSTIWPLAPVMAFLNNWLELRGDAFKIVKNYRRPIPNRTDTIGPWLEALGFISWLAALTNAALVYMFHPEAGHIGGGTALSEHAAHSAAESALSSAIADLATPALLLALSSSHAYFAARGLVRRLLERLFWIRAPEQRLASTMNRQVKEVYLRAVQSQVQTPGANFTGAGGAFGPADEKEDGFWDRDEAKGELLRRVKHA